MPPKMVRPQHMQPALQMCNEENRKNSEAASDEYDFIYRIPSTYPFDDNVLKRKNSYSCDQVVHAFDGAVIALGTVGQCRFFPSQLLVVMRLPNMFVVKAYSFYELSREYLSQVPPASKENPGDGPIITLFSGVQAFGENVMVCWLALLLARIAEVEAGPA